MFLNFYGSKTMPCKLLLSDTHHGDSPRLLFIYKRWVPTIFTIKGWLYVMNIFGHESWFPDCLFFSDYALLCCLLNLIVTYMIVLGCCSLGGGSGSFILKSNSNSGSGNSVRIRTAKYSIALQYLILEGITKGSEQ